MSRIFSSVPVVDASQHDDYATSGSRGEQAMTLAINVVKLASSMTITRLINFGRIEKILSIPRKDI